MTLLHGDCLEILRSLEPCSVDSLVTDPPAGISFMGKSWDDDKGGRKQWIAWMAEVMREAMRVMKPGAHGLVWAIPRTSHWTATALEDAGFEIRDVVTHLFGSGFPKSLDVSKAIDKAAGVEGPITGKNPAFRERQLEHDANWETAMRPEHKRGPGSDAAKQWAGWGTALKPASEHWILIRKPCSEKTVAANVLKWGCGAINIDASRISSNGDHKRAFQPTNNDRTTLGKQAAFMPTNAEGRFPANLLLDEEAAAMLDEQSGISKSTGGKPKNAHAWMKGTQTGGNIGGLGDTGGASRFFYVAKASKADKNAGLDETVRRAVGNRPKSADMTGKFPDHDQRERVGNFHPTVKSTKLMSYLITLVTPPGGTVLDPFTGSGSTGVAAVQGGFKFIGIERDPDYVQIAEKRIYSAIPRATKQYGEEK